MKTFAKIWALFTLLYANTLFAQYSNATLNGPWFLHSVPLYPYNDSLNYLVFDGNGSIIDYNMFSKTTGIVGSYSVTSGGAISGTLMIDASPYPLAGQLVSQNAANMGTMLLSRITHPGALTDSLIGLLSTVTCGQRSVTFRLNSQGQIFSARGLTGPVSGRVFADSGVFIGHVRTGDTGGWEQFSIWGYYSNNSLNGQVGLDRQGCGISTALLVRMGTPTGVVSSTSSTPTVYSLNQNYPNPFNPTTTISFSLPSRSFATLTIFDLLGKKVATLLSEELPAGQHLGKWNAEGFAAGIYFYRLQASLFIETKKLVLVR